MSDKKGFTLVELLGVFVLLGIIALVIIPYATGILTRMKTSDYERFENNIFLATEAYLQSKNDNYKQLGMDGGVDYISFAELIDEGFLSKNLVNPNTNAKINQNYSVKVSKDTNGLNYEILENNYSTSAYVREGLLVQYDLYKSPYITNGTQYLLDLSGNDNNGVLNTFESNSGWQTNELLLDGVDDYVNLGLENYNFGQNITFEALIKINELKTTNNQDFFGNWEVAGGGLYFNTSSKLGFYMYIEELSTGKSITAPANINNWYTVVGTYDGSIMKLYINGELKNSLEVTGTIKKSSVNIALGANANTNSYSNYSNISVKRAMIYNRALTQEEIQQNYEIDKGRFGI